MTKQYNKSSRRKQDYAKDGKSRAGDRIKKFHPISSAKKPRWAFEQVRDHFLDHLGVEATTQRNIDDLVESIRAGQLIQIPQPVMQRSTNTDPVIAAAEDKALEGLYSSATKAYYSRTEDLRTNQPFVRSLIMTKFVSDEMDEKLRNEPDYDTKLKAPIDLMNRIEKFMKESDDGKYDLWDHFQQIQKLFAMRQGAEEGLLSWKNRFKRQGDIVQDKTGDDWFETFIQSTKEFKELGDDVDEQNKMIAASFEMMMATGMLCNSDRKRTEPLIADLREQYTRGQDQYPKTLEQAHNMLSVYMSKVITKDVKPGAGLFQKGGGKKTKKEEETACYVCGKKDCLAPSCPRRWDPKEKWKKPKFYKKYPREEATSYAQVASSPPSIAPTVTTSGAPPSGATIQLATTPQPVPGTVLTQVPDTTQRLQAPQGAQLMQVNTADGRTILVPFINAPQFTQQGTVRTSNVAPRGSRPFIRGRQTTQIGVEKGRTQVEPQYHIVQNVGGQFVMLGSISTNHPWNIDVNSIDSMVMNDHSSDDGSVDAPIDHKAQQLAILAGLMHLQEEQEDPYGLFETSLLDTGATHSTYCNEAMVGNVREADIPLHMYTNVGARVVDEVADVDQYRRLVYFDRDGSANVLSFSELVAQGYRITMDTDVENAMIVHCGRGRTMRFVCKKGVYVFEPSEGIDGSEAHLTSARARAHSPLTDINQPYFNAYTPTQGFCAMEHSMPTVRSNKEGFTRRQVEAAMRARTALHIVGAPNERLFKAALRAGLFKNCDITEEAIDHARTIFGPDASTLKGKSTRSTPKAALDDWIAIPPELTLHNHELTLCIDHMFVNNAIFMTCVDLAIKYKGCKAMTDTTADSMFDTLDVFLRKLNHGGFKVTKIHCDREFVPITDAMMDEMGIQVIPVPPGGHEPNIERTNRTLKERMRVVHARLPFKAIPKIMTEQLGEVVADKTNWFPAKNGISDTYSPKQIVEKRNINFKRDCVAEFGAYCHGGGGESSNTMTPRTMEAAYIRPTEAIRGGHKILNLNTRKFITRPKITVLPATDQVIARVNAWAAEEGVYSLKFFDKNGNEETFQDGDQIAGVDDTVQGYAEEAFDPDYEYEVDETQETHDEELRGQYQDIDLDEDVDLIMDAIDNVFDEEETEQYFEGERPRLRSENTNGRNVDLESPIGDDEDEDDDDYDPDSDDEISDEEEVEDEKALYESVEEVVNLLEPRTTRSSLQYSQFMRGSASRRSGKSKKTEAIKSALKEVVSSKLKKIRKSTNLEVNGSNPTGISMTQTNKTKSSRNGRTRYRKRQKRRRQEMLKNQLRRAIRNKQVKNNKTEMYKEAKHNLQFQQFGSRNNFDYTDTEATLIARCMMQIKDKFRTNAGLQFIQQHYLNKGLKLFGNEGREAVDAELEQLLRRDCFRPEHVSNLSEQERMRAQEAMMLLAEKDITKKKKGRLVFRGDGTREWLSREDTASPTASLEGIELTITVDAYENRDMMSIDVPNAFIQTFMPDSGENGERVVMKITGTMVDILINMEPEYRKYIVKENGKRVIYTVVLRAIYGMLQSSLLWYNQFRGDLEEQGFIFNDYDPCIANKMVRGKQHTIRFHVDDLLSSHVDPKVNDEFGKWLNDKYGQIKPCTIVRGKKHRYLGMLLDFSYKGKVKIRMDEYVAGMLETFPIKFDEKASQETPAANDLMSAGRGNLLNDEQREIFHSFVAKGLFLSKRARLDIHPTVSVLATRVRTPNESDWKKLVRMMRYLHSTKTWHKTLRADSLNIIKHYVDASFAVHPDFRSHTGSTMTMGDGAMLVKSSKQKLNSRSSTEAELIGVDDAMTMILWTKLFMEAQGYAIEENILYQDNKSAILLEKNGRKSAGKRSRAINIRYYFVTDHVEKGNVSIEYCPTEDMIADFMTKPLQGEKFREFRRAILGEQD